MDVRFPLFLLLVTGTMATSCVFNPSSSQRTAAPTVAKFPVAAVAKPQVEKAALPSRIGRIAFVSSRDGQNRHEIYVMNADGSHQTRLTNDSLNSSSQPNFSRDGRKIVFARNMDIGSLWNGVPQGPKGEIWVMNADGSRPKRLTSHPFDNQSPRFSPDGTKIAWTRGTGNGANPEVWVMNTDGTQPHFVAPGRDPVFSPDAKKILCVSGWEGAWQLNWMNADGTAIKPLPTGDNLGRFHPTFSPSGKKIAVQFSRLGNFLWDDTDVCILNADGTAEINLTPTDPKEIPRLRERQEAQDGPTRATFAPFQGTPCFSPDGNSLAFAGNAKDGDGEMLVWVMNTDGSHKTRLVPGAEPSWSPGFAPKSKNSP